MKIKYKPKQSTNNSTKRIIRDSNPKTVIGTLVGFMTTHTPAFVLLLASLLTLTFIVSDNTVYAVSYEYSIKYNDNVVENMPKDIYTPEGKAIGGNLTIANETPTRSGYKFLGWCNTLPTTTDGTDSCSGTTYQPNAGITIASATNFHLYTMWQQEPKTIANATYMQEVETCPSTLETGKTYTLKDSRDDQDYTVAKLADGKCWMTKNLNIAGGTALTSDKTDFDSSYTIPTTDGWPANGKLPASSASGFDNTNLKQYYAYVYNSNSTKCGNNSPCYSYYSWDAATLGSGRSTYTNNTDAPYSICPKGWKLPTTRTTADANWQTKSDFYKLAVAYGMNSNGVSQNTANFYKQAGPGTAPNFLLAGYYGNGEFGAGGANGYYWSSTHGSNKGFSRFLVLGSGIVYTSQEHNSTIGHSVRCLFSE